MEQEGCIVHQKGACSMLNKLNQIPTEVSIRKQLRKIIYGSHLFCPKCHSRYVYRSEDRYRCRKCRRPFSLLSGTWLMAMKLDLRTFWLVLWCWTEKVPVLQTQHLCSLSEEAARHWFRQFRLHLPEFDPILEQVVQLDEAYFKSLSLVMAKQPGTRKLAYQIIHKTSVDRHEAAHFLFERVKPHSQLNTDGAAIYVGIDKWWPVNHQRDIHKRWEFGLTSEIEGMFGVLRTFIRRMYHHVTPEYLPEVVAEFATRFSHPEIFESPIKYLEKTLISVPLD